MEKVFKLDHYLLRYLSECTKSRSDLQKFLSALSSTFKIHIDSEEVVVVKDQKAEDVCPLETWDFAVERAFEDLKMHYTIHFELEPTKLAILQESDFSSDENLKIYYEEGTHLAVVVGQQKQVEKTLNFVGGFQVQQECRMLQVATTGMQRDMCWETVCLENTQLSSAFTILKEDLSEAVRQANRDGVKVELKYQHGS